jgi:hypothetical protein
MRRPTLRDAAPRIGRRRLAPTVRSLNSGVRMICNPIGTSDRRWNCKEMKLVKRIEPQKYSRTLLLETQSVPGIDCPLTWQWVIEPRPRSRSSKNVNDRALNRELLPIERLSRQKGSIEVITTAGRSRAFGSLKSYLPGPRTGWLGRPVSN